MKRLRFGLVVLALLPVAACGGGKTTDEEELVAQVASYDLVVGTPQRFLVGLSDNDGGLIGYGSVSVRFEYLGTKEDPVKATEPGPVRNATYRPVAGQGQLPRRTGPRLVASEEGIGLYGFAGASFNHAGFWQANVTAELDGARRRGTAAFEVLERSLVPGVGDPAPRTVNHLASSIEVPLKAVDSRADGGAVPDPQLHAMTVADALANGKPTMVVVATPVYCVSRFCGPITDSVAALARRFGARMNFIHLEVWKDYEANTINKAAAEWVYPAGGEEAKEPWTFVVGPDGVITHRFDNVASDEELDQAVEDSLR